MFRAGLGWSSHTELGDGQSLDQRPFGIKRRHVQALTFLRPSSVFIHFIRSGLSDRTGMATGHGGAATTSVRVERPKLGLNSIVRRGAIIRP